MESLYAENTTFAGVVKISNATPTLTLTDTDNNSNINLSSVGGALIVNSTSDQVFQIIGTEYFRISSTGIKLGNSGSTVNTILDEDNMVSDSATALATQQSIKAYVDNATTGVLTYQGTWNADTNSPTLSSGSGTPGYYYIVSVAGSTNLDGITDWASW